MTSFYDQHNLSSVPATSFSTLADVAQVVSDDAEARLHDMGNFRANSVSNRVKEATTFLSIALGARAVSRERDHKIKPSEIEQGITSVRASGNILEVFQRIHLILLWCVENSQPIDLGLLSKDAIYQSQLNIMTLRSRRGDYVVSPATALTMVAQSVPPLPREGGLPLETERGVMLKALREQYKIYGLQGAFDPQQVYVPQPPHINVFPFRALDLSELSAASYRNYLINQALFREMKDRAKLDVMTKLSLPNSDDVKYAKDNALACYVGAEAILASQRPVTMGTPHEKRTTELECKLTGDLILALSHELRQMIIRVWTQ